jgi:hypothetical protein
MPKNPICTHDQAREAVAAELAQAESMRDYYRDQIAEAQARQATNDAKRYMLRELLDRFQPLPEAEAAPGPGNEATPPSLRAVDAPII